MEQLQPQIHEQATDGDHDPQGFGEPKKILFEIANSKMKHQLTALLREIKSKEIEPDRLALIQQQLDELSLRLTGEGVERLDLSLFEEQALQNLSELYAAGAVLYYIAGSLCGFDSPAAYGLRGMILEKENFDLDVVDSVARGLACLDTKSAWEMRTQLTNIATPVHLVAGLAGTESERAWEMRDKYYETARVKQVHMQGLVGLDSDRAWARREDILQAENTDQTKAFYLQSLAGLDSDQSWEARGRLCERGRDRALLEGLATLDSTRAWELREGYVSSADQRLQVSLLKGLAGLDTPRAWELRKSIPLRFEKDSNYDWVVGAVAESLAGLDTQEAWELREKLRENEAFLASIAIGINGDYITSTAWRAAKGLLPHQKEPKS